MSTLRQTCLLFVLSLCSTFSLAQFDTRAPSGLENRALGSPSPLPLAQAFPFYVSETGPNQLRVTWTPAAGHYLYRHAFHFSLQAEAAGELQELRVTLPAGLAKTDQFFGAIEAYYNSVSVDLLLPPATATGTVLLIQYQGCADWGFCYPPQQESFPVHP